MKITSCIINHTSIAKINCIKYDVHVAVYILHRNRQTYPIFLFEQYSIPIYYNICEKNLHIMYTYISFSLQLDKGDYNENCLFTFITRS